MPIRVEIFISVAAGFLVAWVRLFIAFVRFGELFFSLVWNTSSWAFVGLTCFLAIPIDWPVMSLLIFVRMPGEMLLPALFFGYIVIAPSLSSFVSPYLLDKIRPPGEQDLFGAIKSSLENREDGKLCEWTKYDWKVLRSAAHMLIRTQVKSKALQVDEGEALRQWVEAFQKCDDPEKDIKNKYDVLSRLSERSSYPAMRSHIEQAVHRLEQPVS